MTPVKLVRVISIFILLLQHNHPERKHRHSGKSIALHRLKPDRLEFCRLELGGLEQRRLELRRLEQRGLELRRLEQRLLGPLDRAVHIAKGQS